MSLYNLPKEYVMSFNHDFTSISVLCKNGLRLYSINASDMVEEVYAQQNTEHIRIVERLFNTSLVMLVTEEKPNCLKMVHFGRKQDICNCVYPSNVLCVRMNRHRVVVCLAESIFIHNMRDMQILHSIMHLESNDYGLCALSLNSNMAYPISGSSGELQIFNAFRLQEGPTIKAHDTKLTALTFSPDGSLLGTASERGTVIRVFCVKNGQRVQEFRRGVKRCVQIASLVFSTTGDFICASSNTETVHIFKIDDKAVEALKCISNKASDDDHKKPNSSSITSTTSKDDNSSCSLNVQQKNSSTKSSTLSTTTTTTTTATNISNNPIPVLTSTNSIWSMSGYLTKAVTSLLTTSQISDVLSQGRAFATAVLRQPGRKHICGLAPIQNDLHLLMACEDGFLYIYDFNSETGGSCKLLHVHDLRYTLEGVTELNLSDNIDKISISDVLPSTPTTNPSAGFSVEKTPHTHHPKDSRSPASNSPHSKSSSTSSVSVIIENPEPCADTSYAGVLKGSGRSLNTTMTDSAKFRKLCDAIETPTKLYDERQFPPVAIAAKD